MDLEARPFNCFVTVAEEKSFSRAAVRLNISQPALSTQIRAFEKRLGFDLFVRTSRRVELTKEGRLFLGYAKRFVAEALFINRAARDISTNQIRVGAALETTLIPERAMLIERFITHYPDINLQLLNESHAKLFLSLSRHEIDAAIVVELPLNAYRMNTGTQTPGDETFIGLERLKLGVRPIELVLPAEHVLAAYPSIPLQALRGTQIATFNRFQGVALAEAIIQRLTEVGAITVRAPEGNVIALEQFGKLKRIPAVSLGWFGFYSGGTTDFVRRRVTDFALVTHLNLVRLQGSQRPAAEIFWAHATELANNGFA